MSHVFISYVRENQEEVDRLCDELTKHGINIWLDRNDIAPGTRWKQAIRRAIREGAFFIACFSEEYSARSMTYMNEELIEAIEILRQRSIDQPWFIPVKLSDCEIPHRDIGAGETLRDLQWVDLYAAWEAGIQRIVGVIQSAPIAIELSSKEELRSRIILAGKTGELEIYEPWLLGYTTNANYGNPTRRSAIVALRRLGSKKVQPVCISILRSAVDDSEFRPESENLWETAIKTLGEVGDEEALKILLGLWQSRVKRSTFERQALRKAIALLKARLGRPVILSHRAPLTRELLEGMFSSLNKRYGIQHWWDRDSKFQICLEAILTQGTGWKNVGLAIEKLRKAEVLTPIATYEISEEHLHELIRPYGMTRAKATYIKGFVSFLKEEYDLNIELMLAEETASLRRKLLKIKGIGQFTCDNILLYAAGKRKLPINNRIRKVLLEHDLINETDTYELIQIQIENIMPFEASDIKEFDAMVYRAAKDYCHSSPECGKCPLKQFLPQLGARTQKS